MLLSLPRISLGRVALLAASVLSAIGFVMLALPHPGAAQDVGPFPLVAPNGCVAEVRTGEVVVTVEPGALLDGAAKYVISEARPNRRFFPKGETRDTEFAGGPSHGESTFAVHAVGADGAATSMVECRNQTSTSPPIPLVPPGPCEVIVGDPDVEIRVPDTRVPGEWVQVIYADDQLVAVRSDGDLGLRVNTTVRPQLNPMRPLDPDGPTAAPPTYTVVNRNWLGEQSEPTECAHLDALDPVKCIALVYANEVRVQAMFRSVAPVTRVLRSIEGSDPELRGQDDSGAGFFRDVSGGQVMDGQATDQREEDFQYFVQSVAQSGRQGELVPCVTRTVPDAVDVDFGVGRCWAEFSQQGLQLSANTVQGAVRFNIYGTSRDQSDQLVISVETLSPFGLVPEEDLGPWEFYLAAAVFSDGTESARTPCLFL